MTTPDLPPEILDLAQDNADAIQRPVHVIRQASGSYGSALAIYPEFSAPADIKPLAVVHPHYRTLDDIKERNRRLGHHWFEPATMRFFSSRVQSTIYPTAYGRAYFVTSERGPDNIRKYSVRVAYPNGEIDTVGEFQQYRTGRAAHAAARRLAEGGE